MPYDPRTESSFTSTQCDNCLPKRVVAPWAPRAAAPANGAGAAKSATCRVDEQARHARKSLSLTAQRSSGEIGNAVEPHGVQCDVTDDPSVQLTYPGSTAVFGHDEACDIVRKHGWIAVALMHDAHEIAQRPHIRANTRPNQHRDAV